MENYDIRLLEKHGDTLIHSDDLIISLEDELSNMSEDNPYMVYLIDLIRRLKKLVNYKEPKKIETTKEDCDDFWQ